MTEGRGLTVLRAFGGPQDGEMVGVRLPGPVFALLPVPFDLLTDDTTAADMPQVRYDVETVGYHDTNLCGPLPGSHDRCTWTARCLVAEGYPKREITDALNVVIALALVVSGRAR